MCSRAPYVSQCLCIYPNTYALVQTISHDKLTVYEHVSFFLGFGHVLSTNYLSTCIFHLLCFDVYGLCGAKSGFVILCFFAAVGPPIVFPFLYNSYPEQHGDEIMKLFEVIETMDVPVLMGDFNHGSASPGQGFDCTSCLSGSRGRAPVQKPGGH